MTFGRGPARREYDSRYGQVIEDVADLGWHLEGASPVRVGAARAVIVRSIAEWVRTNGPTFLQEDFDGLGHTMQPWPLLYQINQGPWSPHWQSADSELGLAVARSLIEAGALKVVNETHVRTRAVRQVMRLVTEGLDGWEAARLLQLDEDNA